MTLKPNRDSADAWLATVGKALGLLCVIVGLALAVAGHAETIVFSTGALLFLGGAGTGLVDSFRRPPSDDHEPPSVRERA